MSNLDEAFFPQLFIAGKTLGVPAEWLLNVFYLESRLNPHIGNALGYVGLNQLASSQLVNTFHVDPSSYLGWSASEQLQSVITPWYANTIRTFGRGVPSSPGVLYALNLFPNSVKTRGDSPSTILISKTASSQQEINAYYANANRGVANSLGNCGLDFDCSGAITIGDLDNFLLQLTKDKAYQQALAKLYQYGSPSAVAGRDTWLFARAFLGTVIVGAAAVYAHRKIEAALQQPAYNYGRRRAA